MVFFTFEDMLWDCMPELNELTLQLLTVTANLGTLYGFRNKIVPK
jgi:hypothetical protein